MRHRQMDINMVAGHLLNIITTNSNNVPAFTEIYVAAETLCTSQHVKLLELHVSVSF